MIGDAFSFGDLGWQAGSRKPALSAIPLLAHSIVSLLRSNVSAIGA
ncbi:hypothetical protein [Rhizobium leguminosarum]|nr:hypothetical protein [Rhizobium leguminosarum]MDH6662060.1 hypothetical protein [Rhizobium sophorae]MBY5464028.1 hypothetical protein [Rhizobium leguminosarum]MBY5528367.1 hypothetical protein [Rhizobium leguminosarum]MBY5904918.1 hypothetical protein [Rhizobium leguminosarum]MBY5912009.1 hypothetical protein [Rhizobium leguminosarum]